MSADVIAGRYELGERLGFGGMSTVQLAVDRRLERHVAVKLLAEHLADDSQFVSRFRREALAAARLVHPNIVQVFDFGLDEASGRHYIVMEYIRGRSGAEILREETRLGVADTLELVDGACRGLAHAHRKGVIHRDVKPGNILRSDDGAVKLADFGIAKAVGRVVADHAGRARCSAPPPTSRPSRPAARRSARRPTSTGSASSRYQLLAGRLPYEAGSLTELALMQQREYPLRLDEIAPEVPPALALAVAAGARARARAALRERRGDAPRAARRRARDRAGRAPTTPRRRRCSRARSAPRRRGRSRAPQRGGRRLQPQPPPGGVVPRAVRADPADAARRGATPRRRDAAAWATALGLLLLAGRASPPRSRSRSAARRAARSVQLTPVDGGSTGEIVDQMKQLIDDNTR